MRYGCAVSVFMLLLCRAAAQGVPEFTWVRTATGEGFTTASGILCGTYEEKNTISHVFGSFQGHAQFGDLPQLTSHVPPGLPGGRGTIYVVEMNTNGFFQKALQEEGNSWDSTNQPNGLYVDDESGDIYIAGDFTGQLGFSNSKSAMAVNGTAGGDIDGFFLLCDQDMNPKQLITMGGVGRDSVMEVTKDGEEGTYAVGYFSSQVSFCTKAVALEEPASSRGDGSNAREVLRVGARAENGTVEPVDVKCNMTSYGTTDAFIAKYDETLSIEWVISVYIEGDRQGVVEATDGQVVGSATNYLATVGRYVASTTVTRPLNICVLTPTSPTVICNPTPDEGDGMFIMLTDMSGNLVNFTSISGAKATAGSAVVGNPALGVDMSGTLYITCTVAGVMIIRDAPYTTLTAPNGGSYNMLSSVGFPRNADSNNELLRSSMMLHLDRELRLVWARCIGTSPMSQARVAQSKLTMHTDTTIVFTGHVNGAFNISQPGETIEGGPAIQMLEGSIQGCFIVEMNADGSLVWKKTILGESLNIAGVTTVKLGDVTVVGTSNEPVKFGNYEQTGQPIWTSIIHTVVTPTEKLLQMLDNTSRWLSNNSLVIGILVIGAVIGVVLVRRRRRNRNGGYTRANQLEDDNFELH